MNSIEIKITADGSHTLFVAEIEEHYHSINGAVQESMHVFINSGLRHSIYNNVRVLEIGFGTGLNAFLSMLEAERTGRHIIYHAVELYPLGEDMVKCLNYASGCDHEKALFDSLHSAKWGEETRLTKYFTIEKVNADSTKHTPPFTFDLIYFDAFSPDKQPEMWSQAMFDNLYSHTTKGGIMTTYCAKGAVRRAMTAAGYTVERIPGPPGKREMLRAIRPL